MKKDRRQFLKNTALGSILVGAGAPSLKSKSKNSKEILECDHTTQDYYGAGPFYTENPPMINENLLAATSEPGERMIISGRVINLDCNEFIPETIVDVWHANAAGGYDNSGYNLRGYTMTNAQGFYLFETVKPGKYLNGNKFRPSHIHYKITPPGFPQLTTQLYFEGDTDIPTDAAASIDSGQFDASNRIIPLETNSDGILEGNFDIVINGEGISVGVQDLHLNNGMIYKMNPNPFEHELHIQYGIFKKSKVGLSVFNLQGQEVAVLESKILSPEKYSATWIPDAQLASGHYFVALKINDLQVHYQKIVKV